LVKFFEKIFGGKKAEEEAPENQPESVGKNIDEATIPITETLLRSAEFAALTSEPEYSHLVVGVAQSVGMQRDHNEDSQFTLTANITNNSDNMLLGMFIVADGMGGHKHGELASEIAVRSMGNQVIRKVFTPLLDSHPAPPEESLQEILQASVIEAHNNIVKDAPGGGTTLTAVLIVSERAIIAHVGDSRAYSISADGDMESLTKDHSLVMRMMELGQLTPEDAAIHPQRNVLYRALGQGEPFDPDLSTFPLPGGGQILICSDGLWGVVPEDIMSEIITSASNPQAACQTLVDSANAAGGPDNITAILVRLPE
jgi:protein phosphatase